MTAGPFHEGELALQEAAGVRERLAEAGPRVLRDHMPEQHREFFALLPFLIAGSVDGKGQPWASALAGPPGFARSPEARQLQVEALPAPHDPLAEVLAEGASLGLLGIQPHTRRRNRLNGHVVRLGETGFLLHVDQSFGNCPKYIQAREPRFVAPRDEAAPDVHRSAGFDPKARAMVARADTFFIATAHPLARASDAAPQGVDVSHRGGKPGFVRIEGDLLTVPDYLGNFYFNTLGNLLVNPRCGLLFIDFETGDTLQVAARGEIVTDPAAVAAFPGAQRLLRLRVTETLLAGGALPLRWGPAQMSPVLP